jgi:hypothetical protein
MAKAAKASKASAKDIKALTDQLESRWSEAEDLAPWIDALKTEHGLAVAEGALAKVKEGGRRTFLAAKVAEAKGDAKGAAKLANEVCKKFVKVPSQAILAAGFFCGLAPLATDAATVRAAIGVLAAADPYMRALLPVAAANAEARGDVAEAAKWRERAEIVERLKPILLEIRSETEAQTRAKAVAAIEDLPEADRRFVQRRIMWRPSMIDEPLMFRAVEATLDDHDGVPSATWIAAVGELGDDSEDSKLSKALRARFDRDDAAVDHVVRRMVEADDAPAGRRDDDDDDIDEGAIYKGLCTCFFALRERAGESRVHALVERALEGKKRVRLERAVLETLLHGLNCGTQALPKLSDEQRRAAFAWLLGACKKGAHEDSAQHALFYWDGKGVEDLVEEALAKEKEEEIIDNLYSVVGNLKARDLLVRRIPREKLHFWRLQNAIGDAWSPEWHAALLDQIDAWGDARLAEIYLEALLEHVKRNARVADLARRVLAWKPSTGDAARYRKRVMIEGTRAAIEVHEYALARQTWAAGEAIKAAALSNEHTTERKSKKVPDPFAEKADKAKLKKLLSGELEKAAERIKQKVTAARAAGKPQRATDDTLSALAGSNLGLRVYEDRSTHETLFVDADGNLRFYDGFELAEVPLELSPLDQMRVTLADQTRCDERVLAWDKPGQSYRELVRWGTRVMLLWGKNNDYDPVGRIVLFDDATSAHAFYERVKGAAPEGFTYGTGYFAEGKGGVAREYVSNEDEDGEMQAVLGDRWGWGNNRFESPAEAERMYEDWELDSYKNGARLKNLEWMERLKRDQDFTLREWLDERARDDEASVAWHIDAFEEFERVLRKQGVWPDGATVSKSAPAAAAEIDSFEAAVEVLPAQLRELWECTNGASWKLGAAEQRLLGPSEALAFRPKMQAWLDRVTPKWGSRQAALEPKWRRTDALVINHDDKPIVAARCMKDAGTDLFITPHGQDKPDGSWTDSLAWNICIAFTHDFVNALSEAEPLLFVLKYGQAAPADRKTVTLTSGDKVWSAVLDEASATFYTIAGKRRGPQRTAKKKNPNAAAAKKAFDAAVKAKRAEGFKA